MTAAALLAARPPPSGRPYPEPAIAPIPVTGSNLPVWPAYEPTERTRILKIEETGDFYDSKVRPRIRLSGRGLERAELKAGHRVQVEWVETGVLPLRFIETSRIENAS